MISIHPNDRLAQFKTALMESNWDPVLRACDLGNPNEAYELFIGIYNRAYDDAFPIIKSTMKGKTKIKQPWMTTGLLKSCKKKTSYI